MKQKGYKVIKIYLENETILYDIAVFGENSLIVDNIQSCEKIYEKVTADYKACIEKRYGKELSYNFINDTLIIM